MILGEMPLGPFAAIGATMFLRFLNEHPLGMGKVAFQGSTLQCTTFFAMHAAILWMSVLPGFRSCFRSIWMGSSPFSSTLIQQLAIFGPTLSIAGSLLNPMSRFVGIVGCFDLLRMCFAIGLRMGSYFLAMSIVPGCFPGTGFFRMSRCIGTSIGASFLAMSSTILGTTFDRTCGHIQLPMLALEKGAAAGLVGCQIFGSEPSRMRMSVAFGRRRVNTV